MSNKTIRAVPRTALGTEYCVPALSTTTSPGPRRQPGPAYWRLTFLALLLPRRHLSAGGKRPGEPGLGCERAWVHVGSMLWALPGGCGVTSGMRRDQMPTREWVCVHESRGQAVEARCIRECGPAVHIRVGVQMRGPVNVYPRRTCARGWGGTRCDRVPACML